MGARGAAMSGRAVACRRGRRAGLFGGIAGACSRAGREHAGGVAGADRRGDQGLGLAGAQAFVLPSFSENFGIAAAEALMAGLPCVLGRGVAIAAEVEAAGAGWVTLPDAQHVAEALRQALAMSSDQRTVMARAARDLADRRFSAQAMGRGLLALYREILGV